MTIQISSLPGHPSLKNRNTAFRGTLRIMVISLLCLPPSFSWAAGYSVVLLTPEKIKNTTYTIPIGNRSLNNKGQVIGTRREDSSDGFSTFGNRAVLWKQGKMYPLGTLGTDVNQYGNSIPAAINDAGQVAGTSTYIVKGNEMGPRAFLWSSTKKMTMVNTQSVGFFTSKVNAINAKGNVYGDDLYYEKSMDKGRRAFLTLNGKAKALGSLGTDANGIGASFSYTPYSRSDGDSEIVGSLLNNKGQAVGTSVYYDKKGTWLGYHPFLWTAGKLVDLGALDFSTDGSSYSFASAINDNGQVTGWSSFITKAGVDQGNRAFLWANGKMTNLGAISASPEGNSQSYAIAINSIGQVLGESDVYEGKDYKGVHGFLWFKGKMTDLGTLGINDVSGTGASKPNALNNKGQVVGNSSYSENGVPKGNHAFIYQKGKMLDLNTLLPKNSGWLLENALAINDRRQITVYGTYSKGITSYKAYALLTPGK
ncbi:DUF3466 family protein [Crenothrix polyspora]|uniref:Putative Extracellular repeat protein, HAF family n=1 Tax=Crenothrix polyspora TaxID=360316 RepID=A0A1R4H7H0_9GAMM|nr:DUF3466 family protein [Crenothrix polyspora]SJM92193.1 putative Extracellular repeat protein, HAF family [Crenothrix polyspora]